MTARNIVDRLRDVAPNGPVDHVWCLLQEAADEIQRISGQKSNGELLPAEPFVQSDECGGKGGNNMTEYNDWIIWNATPDSKCPVPEGTMGQVQLACDTRLDAFHNDAVDLQSLLWDSAQGSLAVTAYRTVKEPPKPRVERMAFDYDENTGTYEFGAEDTHVGKPGTVEMTEDGNGNLVKFTWTADE